MSTKTDNNIDNFKNRAPKNVCQYCKKVIGALESPYIIILPSGTEQRWHVACDAEQSLNQSKKKKRR